MVPANRCAFPGCTSPLVDERNQFIAHVSHIEATESGGERFNPAQSDEQRRGYSNLILLCYPHHIETNDTRLYTPGRLASAKADHERVFGRKLFQIDESLLHRIAAEMATYWAHVEHVHLDHHAASNLAIEIDTGAIFRCPKRPGVSCRTSTAYVST